MDQITIFIVIALCYLLLLSYLIIYFIRSIVFYFNKKKFNNILFEGLKTNTIETLDDIINLYANIRDFNPEDIRYLNIWLRDFWLILMSNEKKSIEDTKKREIKLKIDDFIYKLEKGSPFSDVPNKERSILTDIITYSENDNKDAIQNKISELALIIKTKNDSFNKIEKLNKFSIPLAILGVILTIYSYIPCILNLIEKV